MSKDTKIWIAVTVATILSLISFASKIEFNYDAETNVFLTTVLGILVTVLAVLVTFLLGWQIYNAFDIKKKVVELNDKLNKINLDCRENKAQIGLKIKEIEEKQNDISRKINLNIFSYYLNQLNVSKLQKSNYLVLFYMIHILLMKNEILRENQYLGDFYTQIEKGIEFFTEDELKKFNTEEQKIIYNLIPNNGIDETLNKLKKSLENILFQK
ncbi:hypothetical protein ACF3OE_00445 [Capnocytophaga canis]|uniref:hypothetical protein n=1 Tax=Capnocytophaga canis TaxID=1848903 RepID=UPI00370D3D4C